MELKLYNTLSRKKEEFKSIVENEVGLYTCGPTVYNYAHIGNLRTYVAEDILKRTLQYNGYDVKHVMNITDVGHLTGDMDMGEDKLEEGAKREGKTAIEIAELYTKSFKEDLEHLNILEPSKWCKATDYIKEQVFLIRMLEEKEYTYNTSDGVYFDTSKVKEYNKLSHLNLEDLKEGARVEKNAEKKNPTDFALWKFSPKDAKRQMEWESPWGVGFPGWHIECSAMSLKILGKQLDIHCGGIDHINIHHTNEIAQSEAATGEKFFNYWMHIAFLNIEGGKKMSKSSGEFLTLENALIKKGFNPLIYRFACLQVHYRKPMEYSDETIMNVKNGFDHLFNQVRSLGSEVGEINSEFKDKFLSAINDDLNTAQCLAIMQEVLKSELSNQEKLATILDFDKVLGLGLSEFNKEEVPDDVMMLVSERETVRNAKEWAKSDELRDEIKKKGYLVEDGADGMRVIKA